MAENIAAEILRPVGATIIRQFNYLCCFTSNIATLKDEARALDDEAKGLQGRVDGARNDAQIIVPVVETWLTTSKEIMDEMNGISNEATNVGSGCLKLKSRFSLSKRAKKTTDRMKELRGECKFDAISHPRPPAATEAVQLGMTTYEFRSRKQIEEDIMTNLRDGDVNMIGICGMGGLGKTTMAKMIMNRALKENVFQEVVMAVVSQPIDTFKILVEIGEQLGLKDLEKETWETSRVQKLHARLTEGTKRILLVLDDIWESLNIEDIGIPRGSKGCTILLTSRNSDVLSKMDVEKVFGMKILSEEDAWLLFRERAGTCVDDTQLNSMAKEVVEECRGLPIALTTVGAALKDETNKGIWKDTVRQLRKANPTNIPDFIKEVYNPLKISYDRLDSKQAKSVFLLCCLFGEDDDIPLEKLTYFCMGLVVFEGGMEEGRNRMRTLTNMLKSRSLLLDGHYKDCVRMHNIVRDLCIFIAKEEGYIGHNDCTWLSSSFQQGGGTTKLSTNLRLLFLNRNSEHGEEIKFDKSFVEGIKDLQVLCIENYSSFTSLPHATEPLRNLRTLVLDSCWKLEIISGVGELVSLEILICRDCRLIKELPPEIKVLNRLKLLDLTGCVNLERIGGGIISSLVVLEELKMFNSFNKWEAASDRKERQNENASLRELETLINLRCLEIDIDDPAAQNVHLSSKLKRFHIRFPAGYYNNRKMHLHLEGDTCVGDWIKMLLERDTEYLHLTGNGANNVELEKSENIGECETLNIGRTSMNDDGIYGGAAIFPAIEHLSIFSLLELKEIWGGPIPSSSYQNLKKLSLGDLPTLKHFWNYYCDISVFTNLSSIEIRHCPCLRNLGELSIAAHDWLAHLQILSIEECEMMEQVFLWKEEEDQTNIDTTLVFSKLNSLILKSLPRLSNLCKGIESFKFPKLTQIQLKECPLLKEKVFSMNLFFEPDKVKMEIWNSQPFRNAEYLSLEGNAYGNLDVREVQNMRWLIFWECSRGTKLVNVTTMDTLFPQLEVLRLVKLPELEEIWEIDGAIQSDSFQNLKELRLEFLPALKHLWPSQVVSIFNKLSCIYIYGCHKLCNLFSLPVTETDSYLLQLEELVIESCDMIEYVFFWNEGENQSNIHIPKLKVLILDSLPKLRSFCKGDTKIEFPLLDRKRISRCPLLENFVSTDWLPDDWSPNDHGDNIHLFCEPDNEVQEKMELKLRGNITLGRNKIQKCVEYMSIEGDHSTNSDFGVGESMRCLTFTEFSMGTKLMNMMTIDTVFPLLEVMCLVNITELKEIWDTDGHGPKNIKELRLKSLPALKHLWHSNGSSSQMNAVSIFSNLSSIYIHGCHELCNLFSLLVTDMGLCVFQLENLVIENCEMMEQVFLWNEEESQRSIIFPKLKVLKLDSLPRLMSFCEGTESFEFPFLVEMRISRCPLQNLISTDDSPIDHDSIHLFCKPDKVSFGSLKVLSTSRNPFCGHEIPASSFNGLVELRIIEYRSCMSLFSSSIARNLLSLRLLDISECEEMVQVIQHEDVEEEKVVNAGDQRTLLFPKLENLALRDLPKLEAFCEWKSDVELPPLIQVVIVRCPKMTNFTSGKDCISKLEILKIEECELMEQVFLWNEEDKQSDIDTTLVFSQLKSLSLKSLPRLSSLCKGIESFEFPQLTQIQVKDCPILLQNLVSINLFSKPNKVKMEKLWNSQPLRNAEYLSLEGDSSRNLDFRVVQSMRLLNFRECSTCTKLVNVATMHALFPRLEVLRLVKLIELEEIWDIDGPIQSHSFKNFKELRLEFLPKLKHLWQGSSSPSEMNIGSIFNKLSSLHVYGCHELCNLFSLAVTETGSCLLQLEELVIESCDRMEHVFFLNEGGNQSNIIHIPNLKVLILDSLPKLACFCEGIESFEFPSLVQKRISRCPQLKILDSTDNHDDDYIHLFCKPENKVDEKMELKLQGNITLGSTKIQECVEYMSLEGDHSTSSDFGVGESMRCLTFRECSMGTKLMNMTNIASRRFPSIKVLTLRECSMGMKLMYMTTIATPFSHVEVLCLVNIKELEEISDIDGPNNLNELRLKSLPALKHLWKISNTPSQMNAVSIFNKISSIYIYKCRGVRNLFSLSMTATDSCDLQLEKLVIESCDIMEQVFLWNEEKNIHAREFPKLKFLSLSFLPRLTNLCKGIEHIKCPLLAQVKIISCPRLQSIVYWDQKHTFIFNRLRCDQHQTAKGFSTTLQHPRLESVEKPPPPQKEVEGKQSNLIRKTTSKDEEEGRKGEIEEEQNWKTTTKEGGRKCEIEEEQN